MLTRIITSNVLKLRSTVLLMKQMKLEMIAEVDI